MRRKKPLRKDEENFRLQEENRELKALNRSLLKELKRRNRGIHREELKFQPEYVPVQEKPQEKTCELCGKGVLSKIKIAHLTFLTCSVELCGYRLKL